MDKKDDVMSTLIPEHISECALYLRKAEGEPCTSDVIIFDIGRELGIDGDPKEIMTGAKNKLNCESERCVLNAVSGQLGHNRIAREISAVLKIAGPTGSQLLNNFNIDDTLQQWKIGFPEFFPYNFNMLDYASFSIRGDHIINTPDTLATVRFADLHRENYKCAACIINSDTYHGPGKHWMALFVDARGDQGSVEFFNSSGNSPAPEWINWLEKTKNQMEDCGKVAKIVKVSSIRHQNSKSECGVYSLCYVWARLNGVPHDYFMNQAIPDRLMFEFRQHLFAGERPSCKFDWQEYQKTTPIKWEGK